jgi:choline dehydrogenase-like flavoprotein
MAESPRIRSSKPVDFVIVGGGMAGLVLAARLSEDPNVTVVIIEAGKSRLDDPNILMPAMMPALYVESPDYDWCFKSEPQVFPSTKIYDCVLTYYASRRD